MIYISEGAKKAWNFYIISNDANKQLLVEALVTMNKEKITDVLKGIMAAAVTEEDVGALVDSLSELMDSDLPENFADIIHQGGLETIVTALKKEGVKITLPEAANIKQNYYLSKIASPDLGAQIREIGATIIRVQDPLLRMEARFHGFRSTTEYVISKLNEAQAKQDFTALGKYLKALGFVSHDVERVVRLQQAYSSIDSSIKDNLFYIRAGSEDEEKTKKDIAEALLAGDTSKISTILSKDPVVFSKSKLADDIVNNNDHIKDFTDKMLRMKKSKEDVEKAKKSLTAALVSRKESDIKVVLSNNFGQVIASFGGDKDRDVLIGKVTADLFQAFAAGADNMVKEMPTKVAEDLQLRFSLASPPPSGKLTEKQEAISTTLEKHEIIHDTGSGAAPVLPSVKSSDSKRQFPPAADESQKYTVTPSWVKALRPSARIAPKQLDSQAQSQPPKKKESVRKVLKHLQQALKIKI